MVSEGEEEAEDVIDKECKCLLQNLRHEVRVQAVRDYYAGRGIKKPKQECCDKFLSKEQYMKVILKAFNLCSFI